MCSAPSKKEFVITFMTLDISVATIFSGLTTLVITVIGWMLRNIYTDFKEAMKLVSKHEIEVAVLREQIATTKADLQDHVTQCRTH